MLYVLMSLVIAGIGLALGMDEYRESELSALRSEAVNELITQVGSIKSAYGAMNYPVSLNTRVAVLSGLVPEINRFGGGVSVQGYGDGLARIAYGGVPSSVCPALILGTQAIARSVRVGSAMNDVKPFDGVVDVPEVGRQCAASERVQIYWMFGRY